MCVGVDYVLVPKKRIDSLIKCIIKNANEMFDVNRNKYFNDNVGKIDNGDSVKRLKGMIESADGEIVLGGPQHCDVKNRYITPIIIKEPNRDSDLMREEIFGPILPVLGYESFDDVISMINSKEKPLAVYFSGSASSPRIKLLEE